MALPMLALGASPADIDTVSVSSPNGWLKFSIDNTDGSPSYAVTYTGIDIMLDSPLGLTADYGDFSKDLKLTAVKRGEIDKKYHLDRIKKSDNRFEANSLECEFVNPNGDKMILEVQVAHCNIAFRYRLPKPEGRGAVRVMDESTGFNLPPYATGFLSPQSDAMTGWKRTKPSYEEEYIIDAPLTTKSKYGHGFTFPAVFRIGDKAWTLVSEAVLASENMVFSQHFCDNEAVNATLHPIIRNAVGAMEYGGTFLNRRLNRGNDGGTRRMTSDAFQLALAVIYQNPVQNFALAPNNLEDADPIALDFMREVPTLWDDVALLEGYPGKFTVIARRSGSKWYVAGINAEKTAKDLTLKLSSLGEGKAVMISDDKKGKLKKEEITIGKDGKKKVSIPPSSGFVIIKDI